MTTGRKILWSTAPRLFDTFVAPFGGQQFAIGIYSGGSVCTLEALPGVQNPVLTAADVTDIPAAFVADPFMIRREDGWFMFFEVMNRATWRGLISGAFSSDGIRWQYQGIVLREPFHLAYPYIFEDAGEVYLIPDSPGQGIRLYRAVEFPRKWEFIRELRSDNTYSDASIFRSGDRWWMFTAWAPDDRTAKSLRLFHADHPLGNWCEHPASPIVKESDRIARPAGRVLVEGDRIVRLAQDCETVYGRCVHAFEVLELSTTRYVERPLGDGSIIGAGCDPWNAGGMHHADICRMEDGSLLACVDGWQLLPRRTDGESG